MSTISTMHDIASVRSPRLVQRAGTPAVSRDLTAVALFSATGFFLSLAFMLLSSGGGAIIAQMP